ncbi:DNA polymerase-3 subunit gamma/tau [Pseudidiomarina indica]|uniref:DNA polymerase III subunit gamma/tau n=1 Tax=Pseudidiomarina indica TaxID=1159017 RepID=A0A1G6C7G5_9GAMM|nr:DNA polymerase III subunit gamma/tau [Pseudidiomarina indica]SDB28748.1 DNA polymerase-3 subunit gamma/tau [Pseudidiomarina indica]
MSYQVLARKWRPRIFAEVVGQQHVLQPLMNALQTGRLHHAWLLTGTRGVGKTTIARILAKSLNCEQGVTAEPCGQCGACTAIDQGRFVDLLEIDAASRTKVEDTRELLDNVQYAPTQGRFKVYLIDEVHMLSRHSFNALLKTLEEPPAHVKFLLATTDPQKLPITVLSRCLQFNLKALSRDEIAAHLAQVLTAENIPFDAAALQLLARAAQGSMRDALSLTDQAIAQGNQAVVMEGVQQMLGSVPSYQLVNLLQCILLGQADSLFELLEQVASQVPDLSGLLPELQNLCHQMALYQAVPATAQATGLTAEAQTLAQQIPAELLQVFYDILVQGRRDLQYASDVRSGVEMTLLRLLAFRPQQLDIVETTPTENTAPVPMIKVDEASELQAAAEPQPSAPPQVAMAPVPQVEPQPEPEPAPESESEREAPAMDLKALLATREALAQKKNCETLDSSVQHTLPPEMEPEPEVVAASSLALTVESPEVVELPIELAETTRSAAEVDRWAALVEELDVHGLTRQFVRHCVLQQQQGRHFLMVRKSWAYLLNESMASRVKEALANQYQLHIADVLVGDTDTPTPAEIQDKINEQRLQQAEQALAQDTFAQQLEKQLGAQLIADSVKPI